MAKRKRGGLPPASPFYGYGRMKVFRNEEPELSMTEEGRRIVYCMCGTKTRVGCLGLRFCPNNDCKLKRVAQYGVK